MKLAVICSNVFNIDKKNKTGTGIFTYILISSLYKLKQKGITLFASGSSSVPVKLESIDKKPISSDEKIIKNGKHVIFELALISKAFSMQDKFDIFHINMGDGDLVLPFAKFIDKPIVITLHHIINEEFTRKFFSFFKQSNNVFFISASNYQRKILPRLNYTATIPHGVDVNQFNFDPKGGSSMIWAGRLIPEKGPQIAIKLAEEKNRQIKLFGIIKNGFEDWYKREIKDKLKIKKNKSLIYLGVNFERFRLIKYFQKSKLLLLPISAEEAFGLVFIESMSCGTPVVTFARGSAPEVIVDGQTGFLVNPSENDIRGDWIVKKTGFAGLCEAVEKIYSMPEKEYEKMREACRQHVIKNFSAEKMAQKYIEVYKKIIKSYNN